MTKYLKYVLILLALNSTLALGATGSIQNISYSEEPNNQKSISFQIPHKVDDKHCLAIITAIIGPNIDPDGSETGQITFTNCEEVSKSTLITKSYRYIDRFISAIYQAGEGASVTVDDEGGYIINPIHP